MTSGGQRKAMIKQRRQDIGTQRRTDMKETEGSAWREGGRETGERERNAMEDGVRLDIEGCKQEERE